MFLNNKSFIKSIKENNFKYMQRYFHKNKEEIIKEFDNYLFLAENDDNEYFISNFLNLFIVNEYLKLDIYCSKKLREFIINLIKEKKYKKIINIFSENYALGRLNSTDKVYANRFIILNCIELNDQEGLNIFLNLLKDKYIISNIIPFSLKTNPKILPFLIKNFEWIKDFKESKSENVINHPAFLACLVKDKIESF